MIGSAQTEDKASVGHGLTGIGLGNPWHLPPLQRCNVPTCSDLQPILKVLCLRYQWSSIWGEMGGWQNQGWWNLDTSHFEPLTSSTGLHSSSSIPYPFSILGIPVCLYILSCLRLLYFILHILQSHCTPWEEEGHVVYVQWWCLYYRASVVSLRRPGGFGQRTRVAWGSMHSAKWPFQLDMGQAICNPVSLSVMSLLCSDR